MSLLTNESPLILWQDLVKQAENRCSITLTLELEAYLATLLIRFTNKPEVAKQILATAFLEAVQQRDAERHFYLQNVGDQCLIFAGLFPKAAHKKHVKIGYFVDLGRSAYAGISRKTNDLFSSLAFQFVALMDVLQSISHAQVLLPLEAYEQWQEVGSQRAFRALKEYTAGGVMPIHRNKQS